MDVDAASNGALEEHDPQKHIDDLANNWIDRTLTPAIQKQVRLRLCGDDGPRPSICMVCVANLPWCSV